MQELKRKNSIFARCKQNILFKNSCIISIVMCFITHAYAYFNASFFHDRGWVFYSKVFDSARRAKWMQQFVDLLTDFGYLPWMCGVLTIIFFALSVYMIADILEIRYVWNIWLIAGICIANVSVITAHMFWPHEIIVALPFVLVSVWIWKRERKHIWIRIVLEAFFVGMSLASYGAYTSVGPCVVIISLFFALLDNQNWLGVLKRGIEYIASFALGMAFYYIVLRLFLYFQNYSLNSYMGEDRLVNGFPDLAEIFGLIQQAWYSTLINLNGEHAIRLMLVLSGCILMVQVVRQKSKECHSVNLLMMLMLLGIFPLGVGLIHVMAFGSVHSLMNFTYVMPYIGMIALLDREQNNMSWRKYGGDIRCFLEGIAVVGLVAVSYMWLNSINGRIRVIYFAILVCIGIYIFYLYLIDHLKFNVDVDNEKRDFPGTMAGKFTVVIWSAVLTILVCMKVYYGILDANKAYMQCSKIDTVTRSYVTRLLGRVENCEGFEGNEEIIFIGDVNRNDYISAIDSDENSNWDYSNNGIFIAGLRNGITYNATLCVLMKTDAGCTLPCQFASLSDFSLKEQDIIDKMPDYPADGSVRKVEEAIIVKISEE